jgi:predicted nucleotidyltransferase
MSDTPPPRAYFSSTNQLRVLSFLAKFSDQEFHEREIARRTGISYGSANMVLNELFRDGILLRRQAGKMLFYSFNSRDPLSRTFKIFVSVSILRPLIEKLREHASEIVLYGSCARGEDTSASDIDLFIVSENKQNVSETVESYAFGKGFENLVIEPVIRSPLDMIKSEKTEKEFLSLVREGIVLWDQLKDEPGIQGLSESGEDHTVSKRKSTRRKGTPVSTR